MFKYEPTWKEYEEKMHTGTPDEQVKAAEAFETTREKELQTSRKAKEWEEARRKEAYDYKPKWVKAKRKETQDLSHKILSDIKNIGSFDTGIKPAPGYILIEMRDAEEQTQSGLVIIRESSEPNTGLVLSIGNDLRTKDGHFIPSPATNIGDMVIFKKFAGADIDVKGKNCRLLQFTDVLAVLE